MVLGLLSAIAAVPAVVGTTEAVRQGQKQNARDQHRGRRCHMAVTLPRQSSDSAKFNGARIVLKNNKLYVDTASSVTTLPQQAHPFTGYFLPYPGNESQWKGAGFRGEGMVTTISEDPPMLNWVYVDSHTHEVKYGVRADTIGNVTGPWDVTDIDRRVTLEGWEGFTAVQEDAGTDAWALYFDRQDNGIKGEGKIGGKGKRMLFVELWRKERTVSKAVAEEERAERLQRRAEKEEKDRRGGSSRSDIKKQPGTHIDDEDVFVRHEEEVD